MNSELCMWMIFEELIKMYEEVDTAKISRKNIPKMLQAEKEAREGRCSTSLEDIRTRHALGHT